MIVTAGILTSASPEVSAQFPFVPLFLAIFGLFLCIGGGLSVGIAPSEEEDTNPKATSALWDDATAYLNGDMERKVEKRRGERDKNETK
jgi:hypothetical protein